MSVLRDRVSEKEFLADQKENLSKKGPNQDGAMIPAGVEISTNETANFILDRLHVESYDPKTRIFRIEMQEYLPTEEKSTGTAGVQLICLQPASLVPYLGTTIPSGDSGSNEKQDIKMAVKPPALTVEAVADPVASPVTKSPKANVPRIELGQLSSHQEKNTPGTTPPPHNGPTNHHHGQSLPQQVQRSNTSHLHIHTADSFDADFSVYHGRRDQNHRPFVAGGLNTMSNSNPNTARNNAYTPIASPITSPIISPRTASNPPVMQFTPRKGKTKKNHVSILQSVHNTQNAQAAEQRHGRQQIQVNQSNLSHSVGSNHLAPIPLPDQLTKVTTHPTLPPNRNLTPHQEPYFPPKEKEKRKKKHHKSMRTRMREAGAVLSRFFGWRRDYKVHSTHNTQEAVVPILNAHNEVCLVKSSEAQRRSSTASTESAGSAAKAAMYNSSIPKHMQVPLHTPSAGEKTPSI